MGQRVIASDAAVKDAKNKLKMEEFALSMGHRRSVAAVKDAQIKLFKEECALGMGQRGNDAVMKDAKIKLKVEACAGSMQFSMLSISRLLLDQYSMRLRHLSVYQFNALLVFHTKEVYLLYLQK